MLNEDFLKEKQDIRQKMLEYSRAVRQGKAHKINYLEDDENLLKKRMGKSKENEKDKFYKEQSQNKSKKDIYLKEDLINVKLEEKKKFNIKIFNKNKKNKKIKEEKKESENSAKTKSLLLDGYNEAISEVKNLNYNNLLFSILLIVFACAVFVPQIYIRNNIYYLSREIATLRNQEGVLNEENKELRHELESMKFQNQILDYLE